MSTLRGELKKKVRKSRLAAIADGEYSLQDGTYLTKTGDTYMLLRNRDPKKVAEFSKYSEKRLKKLLLKPREYDYKLEDIEGLGKEDLVKLAYPRPRMIFHTIWLKTSSNAEAKNLRKMLRRAKKIR